MKNIFEEPAEPFTLFSYSDFAILIVFNILIFFFMKKKLLKINKSFKIAFILLFLLLFPFISNIIEVRNVRNKFEIVDGFNLLYTFLKIPIWWILGIMNFLLIKKTWK